VETPHHYWRTAEPTTVESDHDVLLHELAALRRSEAVLRDFIETSTIGLHWVGADGTILWANQAELDLLGYAREKYVGRNITEFHVDEPVINDMLARLNRGETLRDHSARMRHRDGSIRHVLVNSSVLFEDGKFIHTRCFTRDVTALRNEQEANRLLAAIVDSSDDAIISEDLTGRITSWNKGAERIFGYTAREAIGQSLMMLIPEDRQEEELQILARLQRGEAVDHFETFRRRKDGKLLNISLTISPVMDRQGGIIGGSEIARDITEVKRAEEAIKGLNSQQTADLDAMTRMQELSTRLIQSGAFSDLLNEILEAGIAITKADMGNIELIDADGETRIAAHRGFEPLFAELLDKVLGRPFDYRKALQPGERVIVEDIASSPLVAGTPMLTVMLDAGARAVQSTPLVNRSGQLLGMFSTYYRIPRGPTERDLRLIDVLVRLAADLIERSRAEEKLRESEERLRFAQDTANIGTFDWDIATGKNTWTTKLETMYGLPLGGFLGTQPAWEALVHPEDRPRVLERVSESLETGAPMEEDEWRVIWPDGSVHWLAGRWRVVKNAGGQPVRMMGVNIDVTDRKRAQEESFARQKLESLGTLASGIAHDFNNLLGGVMAQAELALEESQAGSSPVEELKRIRDGAIRGSEIVRQLMIYAGKESDAVGLVDVSRVARDMLELLKVSISKHAALVTDFGENLPAVRGSTGEIQQIVMNLVTNASEALEDRDGVIRVTTRRVSVDRAEAVSNGIAEGDYVQLEVADTGRGMSLETQAKVFDPFFTTKSQGHGLGMGVVRGIVRGLGGAIHVESELGKGTTFQIFLRSTGIVSGVSGPLPCVGESRTPQLATILIVEDDDALRVALAQILRRRGFETLDAANGADAINLLRANSIKIDMMLLDMTIPGPSSREVAALAAEARPGLKVVLTSAYDEKVVRTTVSATQACGFVRKPFQIDELVYTLRSALSLRATTG
jgi:PAS domain S-box-containing protein